MCFRPQERKKDETKETSEVLRVRSQRQTQKLCPLQGTLELLFSACHFFPIFFPLVFLEKKVLLILFSLSYDSLFSSFLMHLYYWCIFPFTSSSSSFSLSLSYSPSSIHSHSSKKVEKETKIVHESFARLSRWQQRSLVLSRERDEWRRSQRHSYSCVTSISVWRSH